MFALDTAVRAMNAGIIVDEVEAVDLLPFAYADEVEAIELSMGAE